MRLWISVLLAGLLTACSRGGTAPVAPADTVRFDLASDPTSLNPLFSHPDSASVEQELARLVFEPFIDLDARERPVPELLSEIPSVANGGFSKDGRTIVYHLRPQVRWSDGVAVTSDDVLYTLHAILDPNNPVRSQEGYNLIDRATALDAHTVEFHLKRAWAPAVMTYFSSGVDTQFVLPAHVLRTQGRLDRAAFNADPSVGDGPFTFVRWARGESLRYVANPRYWRGKPAVAALDVRIITDPSTNLVMLQSGQLDWNLVAPVQYASLQGRPGLAFRTTPTAVVAGLAFNTARAPLNDVLVRRALAMSIDRDAIVRKITLGKYSVTDMLQPQFSWAYDPSIREPAYDPVAADALLNRAGWRRGPTGMRSKSGVALHLTYAQFPETASGMRIATAVQAALHERGIDVEIKSVSNAQLFLPVHGVLAMGEFDLAYVPWTLGADPDDSAVLACNGTSNYMRWCNVHVDALERRALASTSVSERKRLYADIARITAAEVPILYLFNAKYIYAYRPRLHGFSPNALLPTWNASQWKL